MSSPTSHTQRPDAPGTTPGMERIEQLVRSLRGVISVRAVPDGRGDVETLHVLAADSVTREELAREVESALLTYFDVALEPGQTSVVISHDPDFLADDRSPDAVTSENGARASGPSNDDRWPEPAAPLENRDRREEHHPGVPDHRFRARPGDRPEPGEKAPPSGRPAAPAPAPPTRSPGPSDGPAAPGRSRVRMVRYTAEGDDGPGVDVRVTVEADGERYDGVAHAERLDDLEPLYFAEAAAHAAEIALRSLAGSGDEPFTAFRVEGVERLELFGRPYVAVSLELRGRRSGGRSVTGFHSVTDGPCRAATLAVLDGVDRALD